jgi:small subunit ribosomal protein S20e
MADGKEKGKDVEQENQKFRITISCTKLQNIEQVTNEIIRNAKERSDQIKVRGPVRMPHKNLRISCRRTPCGEGSKTWDSFEMRIYKRYIDLECTNEQVKAVTIVKLPSGVDVNVIVTK